MSLEEEILFNDIPEDTLSIWGDIRYYKDIKIYPVKMKYCLRFYRIINCLLLEKNAIQDINVIRMSYLDFLLALGKQKPDLYESFLQLLKLVLKEQIFNFRQNESTNEVEIIVYKYREKTEEYKKLIKEKSKLINQYNNILKVVKGLEKDNKIIDDVKKNEFQIEINNIVKKTNAIQEIIVKLENEMDYITINGRNEFEEFKKIILIQNGIKHDEELLSPETKQALQEAQEYINKHNKTKQATIEEQITAYHTAMGGMDYEKIKNLTIYQFTQGLQRKAHQVNFEVLGSAMASGMISFKGDPPGWLDHISERGQYDDVIMSEDEFNGIKNNIEN